MKITVQKHLKKFAKKNEQMHLINNKEKDTTYKIFLFKGSADFLGLNHYSSNRAKYKACGENETGYYCDMELVSDKDPAWPT